MASNAELDQINYHLALCRLEEETSGRGILNSLSQGLGCLVSSTKLCLCDAVGISQRLRSNHLLITSNQVLTKAVLQAHEDYAKKKKRSEPSVKIVADFQGISGTEEVERIPLSDLYDLVATDVVESNGLTYVSLTKLDGFSLFGSNLLKGRPFLQVCDFEEKRVSLTEKLTAQRLHCYVLCGERANREDRASVFSTRIYDLFFETAIEGNQGPRYVLTNQEKKRFCTEDEFIKEGEKAMGAIILNDDCQFVGALNFRDGKPEPVTAGGKWGEEPSSGVYPKLDLPTEETETPTTDVWRENGGENQPVTEQIVRDEHQGAAGGTFSLFIGQSKDAAVRPELDDKVDTDHLPQPVNTPTATNQVVTGFGKTDNSSGGQTDLIDLNVTPPPCVTGSSEEEIQQEDTTEESNGSSSPTENSYRSIGPSAVKGAARGLGPLWFNSSGALPPQDENVEITEQTPGDVHVDDTFEGTHLTEKDILTVHLPPKDVPERPSVRSTLPPLSSRSVELSQGSGMTSGASSSDHQPSEQGRNSNPAAKIHRSTSELLRRGSKIFFLDDPLANSVKDALELLEGLGRCLDKEYRYGKSKCWRHLAEEFDIEAEIYDQFLSSQINSPTEVLFEYLSTCQPNLTVEHLKDALHLIGRIDVIQKVLLEQENSGLELTNETLVSSLFHSDPDLIGEMAFLLDMQKHHVKNWTNLANKLHVARKVFCTFGASTDENPTEELLNYLCIHFPHTTIGELKKHLVALNRLDAVGAIDGSKMVSNSSVLKELQDDFDTMDNLCELLNRKLATSKIVGWKHLGNRFKIKKEILDDFSPSEGKPEAGPTEVLMSHLAANRPNLTLANLVWALHVIDRPDALVVLDKYLPDGSIPRLLKACDCERCAQTKEAGKGPLAC